MSTSSDLHKRRSAAVARGVSSMISSYVDHAAGGTLTDVDGREWIDFGSGIAVTSVGNAAPKVVEAVREQVARFTHTCFMITPYEAVGRGEPRFLHLYELHGEDPEATYRSMTPLVQARLGGAYRRWALAAAACFALAALLAAASLYKSFASPAP